MSFDYVNIQRPGGASGLPVSEKSFRDVLIERGLSLRALAPEVLQVNVGKLCNQACKHCHVDASPTRTEIIEKTTVDACLEAIGKYRIPTLDLTGGAPELIPDFRYFVTNAVQLGAKVIVRHNLTVMTVEGMEDLPEFFAENRVELVSSLPYFQERETDAQRGNGVFEKSIGALRRLNEAGYGMPGSELTLNLVHNPVGAFLPPDQSQIEADFKRELLERYDINFTGLFTITNMPIARYLDWLRRSGNEAKYMSKLVNAFNAATVEGLMCRTTLSVDWLGNLFDCDFNQMLDMRILGDQTIFNLDLKTLVHREIRIANHCFGCTAGGGSSCGGTVV
ncbi:MAG: arsenosugar biosynthesis radical SAM protein ArsS [Pyrinomonadaceae bacterium]